MYSDISPEFYTPLCCSLSQEEYYHFNMRTVFVLILKKAL